MSEESKEYGYRRSSDADVMSLQGTETGYLLRLLLKNTIREDYKKLIREELKKREFTDEEIRSHEFC